MSTGSTVMMKVNDGAVKFAAFLGQELQMNMNDPNVVMHVQIIQSIDLNIGAKWKAEAEAYLKASHVVEDDFYDVYPNRDMNDAWDALHPVSRRGRKARCGRMFCSADFRSIALISPSPLHDADDSLH
jgi:hypothetical protein